MAGAAVHAAVGGIRARPGRRERDLGGRGPAISQGLDHGVDAQGGSGNPVHGHTGIGDGQPDLLAGVDGDRAGAEAIDVGMRHLATDGDGNGRRRGCPRHDRGSSRQRPVYRKRIALVLTMRPQSES